MTGGSDGSVRVWSLQTYTAVHRLAAHDNSVTSLQFDDSRIVSGGSDGRVKIWDLRTGLMIRELSQPAEAVWRVAFEDERAVVLASRHGRTVMELWDFAPPEDDDTFSARPRLGPAAQLGGIGPSAKALEDAVLMDEIHQLNFAPGQDASSSADQQEGVGNVDMVDAYGDTTMEDDRDDLPSLPSSTLMDADADG